jgi:hypothetical protein
MQRFWNKVNKQENGCWEWTAHLNTNDYGQFKLDGKLQLAHRASWMFEHGPISDGMHVLHHCDNPSCVNPAHLFLGTHADNMRDMAEKGRAARNPQPGESNGSAKLTEADVLAIRSDKRSQRAIAAEYGVGHSAISLIKNRKVWTHI